MSDSDSKGRGDSSKGAGTFQVKDRRRFDSDGNERGDSPQSVETHTITSGSAQSVDSNPPDSRQGSDPRAGFTMKPSNIPPQEEEIEFSSFVMSLATQALVQLGEMEPPPGMELPVDREAARQSIEILGMIQRKTLGNVTAVEAKLLEDILHNLRVGYIRHAKEAAK